MGGFLVDGDWSPRAEKVSVLTMVFTCLFLSLSRYLHQHLSTVSCCAWMDTDTAKLILISKNCPPLRKSEIEYYAML